jgi:hypothetical protein
MRHWKREFQALVLTLLVVGAFAPHARAQGARKDDLVLNAAGQPLGGVNVAVCSATATIGTSTTPCSPLVNIYTDATLTTTAPNPFTTDGLGNYGFWAPPGTYQTQIYGLGATTTMKPVVLACVPASSCAFSQLNNIIFVDGVTYPRTDAGFRAAIAAAGANGQVVIPPGATVGPINTATPIAVSVNNLSIVGSGEGSSLTYSGTGNLFNISGAQFTADNFALVSTTIGSSRASASLFNLQGSGALLGKLTHLYFSGDTANANNGRVFNADLSNTGTGEWKLEDWVIVGGSTWTNGVFLRTTTGTVSGFTLKNLICFTGTTMSDAFLVFDTGVDTVKMSDLESGCTGMAINARNSLAGAPPEFIACNVNCRLEAGGNSAGFPVVQIDDVNDFRYSGQVASGKNGFVVNGGRQITVTNTQFKSIGQDCVLHSAAAANVSFVLNIFEDCGVLANNTYDYVKISAGAQDFDYSHNQFRQLNANKAKYGFDLLAGASAQFTFVGNDFSAAAIGTGYLNNLANGSNQNFIANKPSAAFANVFSGTIQANGGVATVNLLLSTAAPTISSGFGTSPSIVQQNGTAAFEVNVGTGGAATSGVIGLPTAANGWSCTAIDMNTNIVTRETAFTASSVTFTAASAWTASDKLLVQCGAF